MIRSYIDDRKYPRCLTWQVYLNGMKWGVPLTMFVIIKLYGDLVDGNGERDLYNLTGYGHIRFGIGGAEGQVCGIALGM